MRGQGTSGREAIPVNLDFVFCQDDGFRDELNPSTRWTPAHHGFDGVISPTLEPVWSSGQIPLRVTGENARSR